MEYSVIGTNVTYLPSGDLVMQITVYVNGVQAYSGETRLMCGLFGCEAEEIVVYGERGSYEVRISITGTSGGGSGSNSGSNGSSGGETTIIKATMLLEPIYNVEETPWGEMPILDRFTGTSMVNNTNITVEAFYSGGSNYNVYVYVNSSYAYGTYIGLPATLEFSHNNTEYEVRLELPEPPSLNQTVELELVPVDWTETVLLNDTVINVTIYMVNQTITINNTTVVVYGYVSRLGVDLDIYVFGVPPANHSVSVEGIDASIETDYSGAFHAYTHYDAPENQLIPINTTVKTTIQPLSLTITFTVLE